MIDYGFGVSFKTIEDDDAEFLFNGRNEKSVRVWCRQVGLLEWSNHCAWMDAQAEDDSVRMFLVMNEDRESLGCAGLTSIDLINRRAEFSCWIHPEHQGKGYARGALYTLFKFGFDELNLNRIWGETFFNNPARRLFAGIGMAEEGVRRDFYFKCGDWVDAVLYSINHAEFNAHISNLPNS